METTKEKAEELVKRFTGYSMTYYSDVSGWDTQSGHDNAVQCAHIAVDEILNVITTFTAGDPLDYTTAYWKQVKTEIEKL